MPLPFTALVSSNAFSVVSRLRICKLKAGLRSQSASTLTQANDIASSCIAVA